MMDTIKIQNLIGRIGDDPRSGFLFIDKPVGQPSMRTVSQLRRITGQKKIGFAGTLDPAASGLLIIGINKATKVLDYWHQFPKLYEAEITLGSVSTTYDSEGEIKEVGGLKSVVDRGEVETVLQKFVGTIQQTPPMYSAKSIGGKRLYQLARAGKEVERKSTEVSIHSIDIVDYHFPKLTIRVQCSTGTYIRSLAHDIGQVLGTGAYLSELRRVAIGDVTVQDAQQITTITADNWIDRLRSIT